MEDSSAENDPERPAKTKPPEGTVVRAANQTAGRGQLGSRWHSSPEENLLLSVIFYPTWLEAQAQFYLSMAVALGLNDVIGALGHSSLGHSIKWPNDLYLGSKKTAGILIQNALSGSTVQSSIVGIGLNVNQLNFPPELPHATSLALAGGQKLDLNVVADRLFECLERRYLQLKAGHRSAIKAEYEENLWRRGERSRFVRSSDNIEFEGIILGVTQHGFLRVETVAGMEEFEVKQLKFVP
jgi:BirA family biotin operon repressor/biotin-[acetyl-CoA-carboxylase] ligase